MFRLLDRACALGCLMVIGFCLLGLLAATVASFQPAPGFSAWPLVVLGLLVALTAVTWLLSRPGRD